MQFDIPEYVFVTAKDGETASGIYRRLLMEAARQSGLPLLEQTDFANYVILTLGWKYAWKDTDQTPQDDKNFKDYEIKSRAGNNFRYYLSPLEKDELKRQQIYYVLNGGTLGSGTEAPRNETIVVDLNIVYDPNLILHNKPQQSKLDYVTQALQPKLEYWSWTFSKINIDYTVRYNTGTVNSSRTQITSGLLPKMVNIFFLNDDARSLTAYAKTDTGSKHIFISENKNDVMPGRDICHELGHYFGYFGLSGIYALDIVNYLIPVANLISDPKINWALRQLKNDNVRYGVDWTDDYRNASEEWDAIPGGPAYLRKRSPTIYDYFRYGARMVREEN